jgi:hypothetical protein
MRVMTVVIAGILAAWCAFAAGPDYFPLQTGNQWVYKCSGLCGDTLPTMEISGEMEFDGRKYFSVAGLNGALVSLRLDEQGILWAYDTATRTDRQWYAFATAEGGEYLTSLDLCSPRAIVASRAALYEGPVGRFTDVLRIVYPPSLCRDAGLQEELFHPGAGLLRRVETTIGGPRTFDLTYARLGARVIAQPEVRVSLTLDRSVYIANLMPPVDPQTSVPMMTARLTLRNDSGQTVVLTYPSGQRYDLEIKNARGEVVYRWSDDKMFTMVFGRESLGKDELSYVIEARLSGKDGKPLPQGKYTADAWLATEGPPRYSATVGFEIRHVY